MTIVDAINFQDALRQYFGFDTFKGEQEDIIRSVVQGKDTFVLMPTGGGKSLCYQLPAMILDGTAIVISPLIALMKNQVDLVRGYAENDSIAHFFNSSLNKGQKIQVQEDVKLGKTKLLYIAPETLTKDSNMEFLASINISFIAVDEAHCISEWGHDFRPEYRRIKEVSARLENPPVVALTATATPKVQSDILRTLGMTSPNTFIASFNRKNLYYEIRHKKNDDMAIHHIVQLLKKHQGKSAIIYVLNRKSCEKIAEILQVNGLHALPYHAGLDNKVRAHTQDAFLKEGVDVIVATIAFGMGIDKPDIRLVIHFNIAKSLENYYQETGRAGRDGMEGICIAFFNYKDITKVEKLMKDKSVTEKERAQQLMSDTVAFVETAICRRTFILHYFGEDVEIENCGQCDNCVNPKKQEWVKTEMHLAFSAVSQLNENQAIPYVIKVLMGQKNQEIKAYKHDQLAVYGQGKNRNEQFWNSILRQGLIRGFLHKDIEQYGVLKLTQKGRTYLNTPYAIEIPINHDYQDGGDASVSFDKQESIADKALMQILKNLRKQIAGKHSLPPYIIFQDPSLEEMTIQYPITLDELSHIVGVSTGKAKRYGLPFIKAIKEYVQNNQIDRPVDFVVKSLVNKSVNKVKIIQSVDQKIPVDEIAENLHIEYGELIDEIESIVNSGTKIDINYYLENILDKEIIEDLMDFFRQSLDGNLEDAYVEFEEDDLDIEDIQLIRIKFVSEMAN